MAQRLPSMRPFGHWALMMWLPVAEPLYLRWASWFHQLWRRLVFQHLARLRTSRHWPPAIAVLDLSLKSPKWFRLSPRRLVAQRCALVRPTMYLSSVK